LSITVADARLFENDLFDAQSPLRALLYDQKSEIWRSLSTVEPFPKPVGVKPEELRFRLEEFQGKRWFQMAFSIRWPNVHDQLSLYQVVLWKDAGDYFALFKRFRQTLWLWFAITIALLMVVMWLVMRWGLRPLRAIGDEVRAIEDGRKDRFDSDYPSEIKPLTQNLNLLLQREEHQMKRYRHALDDLAHSLKTPLAVLAGLAQQHELNDDDVETLREQNSRMNQIVSYQLQKAATVGGDLISKPVALNKLIEKTVNALSKVYPQRRIRMAPNPLPAVEVRMDESDLLELLGNLLDNACKYGQQQAQVSIDIQGAVVGLAIEDDGKGIESEALAQIIQRGKRLDQSREGQGIGLAVVDEIVNAYELELNFDRSRLGGLRSSVTLELA
jgi:two-component system sensor histidine kinase PhoQ